MPAITLDYAEARRRSDEFFAAYPEANSGSLYLTAELGVVDFHRDGSAVVTDGGFTLRLRPYADRFDFAAVRLIIAGYAAHGVHTLVCSHCGENGSECVVDGDCSGADVEKINALIQHAMFDHAGRADIVAILTVRVLTPADLGL